MSTRYEGCSANQAQLEVLRPGEELGVDRLDKHALVISYDEVFYIEGTRDDLVAMLERAIKLVKATPNEPLPLPEDRGDYQ